MSRFTYTSFILLSIPLSPLEMSLYTVIVVDVVANTHAHTHSRYLKVFQLLSQRVQRVQEFGEFTTDPVGLSPTEGRRASAPAVLVVFRNQLYILEQ